MTNRAQKYKNFKYKAIPYDQALVKTSSQNDLFIKDSLASPT